MNEAAWSREPEGSGQASRDQSEDRRKVEEPDPGGRSAGGRLTKVRHPWTNGQVERMNHTIKDATVKPYRYDSHRQLEANLRVFIDADNCGRRLKTLKGPHALRVHLQIVDKRTRQIQDQSDPPNPGTKHPGGDLLALGDSTAIHYVPRQ